MKKKEAVELFVRYIVLALLALGNLWLFYLVFTPLTVYPVMWLLGLFYSGVYLVEGTSRIIFNSIDVDIVAACVAGSAYYLLLILNLTTPMKKGVRAKSVVFLMAAFLLLNIIRIVLFSMLYYSGFNYFEVAHKITWYAISTIMVVAIWFVNVWVLKIKEIPVYSDAKQILEDTLGKNKKKLEKKKSKK